MLKILDNVIKLYLKITRADFFLILWRKIEQFFKISSKDFFENFFSVFQSFWQAHFDFFYKIWQVSFLKRARDWWFNFWKFSGELKNLIQSIPISKQERKALFRSLSRSFFVVPFGILFVLISLAVIFDSFPFWRKLKPGPIRNFFAYYQFIFFRVLFFIWQQFLPPKEIYVKMALAYLDIGDFKNAEKIARLMKDKFPREKIADELVLEINKLGG